MDLSTTNAPDPDASPSAEAGVSGDGHAGTPPSVSNDRLQTLLDKLNEDEQEVLADILHRGLRDRETHGPVDELSLIANALKSDPETDDVEAFLKAKEKVGPECQRTYPGAPRFELPTDLEEIDLTFPEVIQKRTSRRAYTGDPISMEELSTLLYLGYGVRGSVLAYNRPEVPVRTVPTIGGLQSIEVYAIVNGVQGLDQGLYHYDAVEHELEQVERGNMRWKAPEHVPQHTWMADASVVFVMAPQVDRISWKYNRRSYRMVHLDAGIVTQNLHMTATSMDLGSCMVMGYQDDDFNHMMGFDGRDHYTILLMAVGRRSPISSVRPD